MKGERMCPNEQCAHFGKPTKLAGGCNCGAAFVAYRDLSEPTNEQLGRLVWLFSLQTPEVATVTPELATQMLERHPGLRKAWIERHREVQAALTAGGTHA